MKKSLMVVLAILMAGFAVGAENQSTAEQRLAASKVKIPLAEARGRIDKAIASAAVMKQIMLQLSAADQKQFVADVNKAISDMPASAEEKSAAFLQANMAAISGAEKGNTATIIAEVYATVPPEHLTVFTEQLAKGPLSRSTPEGAAYTDAAYEKIATELSKKVVERCAETENGSTRSVLLMLALVEAAGERMATDLADKLVDQLPSSEAKALAKEEWLPSALGKDDREKSFDPILASADAGRRPDLDQVIVIAGAMFHDSVLADLGGKSSDPASMIDTQTPIQDAVENVLQRQANALGTDVGGDVKQAAADPEVTKEADIPEGTDDRPYQWQKKQ